MEKPSRFLGDGSTVADSGGKSNAHIAQSHVVTSVAVISYQLRTSLSLVCYDASSVDTSAKPVHIHGGGIKQQFSSALFASLSLCHDGAGHHQLSEQPRFSRNVIAGVGGVIYLPSERYSVFVRTVHFQKLLSSAA